MTLPDNVIPIVVYFLMAVLAALAIGYTVAPKRTRKTVNYILNTFKEAKQAKEHPEETIEVPDFETKQLPKVPNPRTSGEKKNG